jgi:hypothetical protein
MTRSKKSNWWYVIIIIIIVMFAFGWFFNLGEDFGKALAQ